MAHDDQPSHLSPQPPPSPPRHDANSLDFDWRHGTLPNATTISAEASKLNLPTAMRPWRASPRSPCTPATEPGTGSQVESETNLPSWVGPDNFPLGPCRREISWYACSPTHPRVGSSAHTVTVLLRFWSMGPSSHGTNLQLQLTSRGESASQERVLSNG